MKRKTPAKPPAPSYPTPPAVPPAPPATPLARVKTPVPEPAGNLKAREAAFKQRRRGPAGT